MKSKFINYNLKIFLFIIMKLKQKYLKYLRKPRFLYSGIQILSVLYLGVYDGSI